jgi:hypothetical protein
MIGQEGNFQNWMLEKLENHEKFSWFHVDSTNLCRLFSGRILSLKQIKHWGGPTISGLDVFVQAIIKNTYIYINIYMYILI